MAEISAGGTERRKQLVVDRPLQGRMIGYLALFVIVPTVLFFILVFLQGPHQGPQKLIYLLVNLILILILVLFSVVFIGLRFTNKIVGPVHHFGRQLTDIIQGNYTRVLTFRKGDQFQNVAGAFNLVMTKLRGRVQEDLDALKALTSQIESLATTEPEKKQALIDSVQTLRTNKERHLKGSQGRSQ